MEEDPDFPGRKKLRLADSAPVIGGTVVANETSPSDAMPTSISISDARIERPSNLSSDQFVDLTTELSSSSSIEIWPPSDTDNKKLVGENPRTKKAKLKPPKDAGKDPSMSPDDATEFVEAILMIVNALIRRFSQLDEVKDMGIHGRTDKKAGAIMMEKDLRINNANTIGNVRGVEIGDLFYLRVEMFLVGLHAQTIAGIDYQNVMFDNGSDVVALSIVSEGGDDNDVNFLVYSGIGGGNGRKNKKQVKDQKLESGNLALERSYKRSIPIRVIRSEKNLSRKHRRLYMYDGLYTIREMWVEKDESNFNLFKYRLQREPGQPDGFAVWKASKEWKANPSSRPNVIFLDISRGIEKVAVCLVNDVDAEPGPSSFRYTTEMDYEPLIGPMKSLRGCMCYGSCITRDASCICTERNGGDLPFGSNGILAMRKPVIYECGAYCQCSVKCRNRVTQNGIRLHFEVFRTKDRGWGLRSWDPIEAGAFICEYIGAFIDVAKLEKDVKEEADDYIFNLVHSGDKASSWNQGPELLGGECSRPETRETPEPLPILLSAKNIGNVSRFINHSCSPNLFWQPVQHDHGDEGYPHIMLFALKHITSMTELTYDYGVMGIPSGVQKCLCGALKCRGYFG